MKRYRISLLRYSLFALAGTTLAALGGRILAQENIGSVRQPLIAGTVIDRARQEEFALLELSAGGGVCSASLLRNGWAVTAAHCVEVKDADDKPMPDPARPGQNVLKPTAGITLKANWSTEQQQSAVRVETFRPYDVAIIQTAAPFTVRGRTSGYSRLIFQDGQFPHFGEPVGADLIVFGRGINQFATGTGDAAVASQSDGQYRIGYARATRSEANLYWYPSQGGQMIAGGDSGGPSFAWGLGGYALVGVHALAKTRYVEGKPKTGWTWVTATPEAADAPIAPVLGQITRIMGPAPPPSDVAIDSPPPGFIGTFSTSPPDFQPLWVYGIRPNGELLWYRKETNAPAWKGPKKVGASWGGFRDVIAAGGNRFYALTNDGNLLWYQHDGFNEGSIDWKGASLVGSGWGDFKRIFAGGDGIVYVIKKDGTLVWYRHTGFNGGERVWSEPKVIGASWNQFRDVFSTGKGAIYAVRPDGTMIFFQHDGYATGDSTWKKERIIGSAWNQFRQIIPVGDGVILALRPDGKLLWYRHRGLTRSVGFARLKETWDGPVEIGSGWHDFGKLFALLPAKPDVVR